MRKIFILLNRYYNQNKNIIWFIIIAITLFLLVIKNATDLLKKSNNSSSEYNTTTIVENGKNNKFEANNININILVPNDMQIIESITTNQEAIRVFINFCNDGKIESAYNMLSNDCKEYLYPTKSDFIKKYYNNFFNTKKELAISSYKNNTYKVDLSEDLITTGYIDKNKNIVIDYITVDKNYKLNIFGFIQKEQIQKTQQSKYISIDIQERYICTDYEIYSLNIKNLTKADICLDDMHNSNLYIKYEDGEIIKINISDYTEQDLKLMPNQEKNINLKFKKAYNRYNNVKCLVFDNIKIINKLYYDNTVFEDYTTENSQELSYSRKLTTYPDKVKIKIEF